MKDMNDVYTVVRNEVEQWFSRQCENIWDDYYLYYLPTTAEHNGGLLITKEAPANPSYQLVERVRKDSTKDQVRNRINELARKLPILEY